MASLTRFCSISASIPCRRMKFSIEFLRLEALLLLISFLLGDGVNERVEIDKIEVAADPSQVPCGRGRGSLERVVIAAVDIFLEVDVAVGMRELDDAPRGHESAGRACRHAGQGGTDLRDCSGFGQFALETYVA